MSILKRGMKGVPVKRLQEKLGVTADGDFGPGTEKAVKEYQAANGLAVDGIAGPDTFTHMGLYELVLLRRGSRGAAVKKLQEGLGIGADGIFGPGTEKAVKAFQEKNGLVVDGLAGPATLAALDTFEEVTAETVEKATVQPDEEHFAEEPMPEVEGTSVIKRAAEAVKDAVTGGARPDVAAAAPEAAEDAPAEAPKKKKSVWEKVTGWFG